MLENVRKCLGDPKKLKSKSGKFSIQFDTLLNDRGSYARMQTRMYVPTTVS